MSEIKAWALMTKDGRPAPSRHNGVGFVHPTQREALNAKDQRAREGVYGLRIVRCTISFPDEATP